MSINIERKSTPTEYVTTDRVEAIVTFLKTHPYLGTNSLPVRYYPEEEGNLLLFLEGLECLHRNTAIAVFVPPPEGDDGLIGPDPLVGKASHQDRAYLYVFSNEWPGGETVTDYSYAFSAPAFIFYQGGETITEFLSRIGEILGPTFRIVPCSVVSENWGGKPDEFGDRLIPNLRRDLGKNILIYQAGISVVRYLELVRQYPTHGFTFYEEYFNYLRTLGFYNPPNPRQPFLPGFIDCPNFP